MRKARKIYYELNGCFQILVFGRSRKTYRPGAPAEPSLLSLPVASHFLTFSFGFVEKGGNGFTSALTWDLGIWGMCGLRIYLKKGRVEVGHFEDAPQSGNAGLIPNLFNELC